MTTLEDNFDYIINSILHVEEKIAFYQISNLLFYAIFLASLETVLTLDVYKRQASDSLNFEKAIELKEMLKDIDVTLTKQKIDLNKNYNFDVFGYYHNHNYLSIVTFYIREGLLFGRCSDIFTTMEAVSYTHLFYCMESK